MTNTNINISRKIYESKIVPPVLKKELDAILDETSSISSKTTYHKARRIIHTDLVTDLIWTIMKKTTMPVVCKAFNITLDEYYDMLNNANEEESDS